MHGDILAQQALQLKTLETFPFCQVHRMTPYVNGCSTI